MLLMDEIIRPFGYYLTHENYFYFYNELIRLPKIFNVDTYQFYYVSDAVTYLSLYVVIGYLIKLTNEKFWIDLIHVYCIPMAVNVVFELATSTRHSLDWSEAIAALIGITIFLYRQRDYLILKMFAYLSR